MSETLIRTEKLVKGFGGDPVLKGIDLELGKGCILGLVGENGAGKSTFVKCITGIHKPDSGKISVSGTVSAIPQEFNLVNDLTVAENIFLGREKITFGFINRKVQREETGKLMARLDTPCDPDRLVDGLGVAEKQMVEIAKALSVSCSVLIMDEPTTVLNKNEARILFGIMRSLRDEGRSVIFISHRLDEICEVCDEVAVLRDGELVFRGPAEGMTPALLAEKMVGRELSRMFPEKIKYDSAAEIVFEAKNISSGEQVKDVSFSLAKGSVTGFAGLAGAGRTELAEAVCALRKRDSGKIFIHGKEAGFKSVSGAVKAGLVYLTEDRQGAGILGDFSVTENITLSSLAKYCTAGFIRRKKETRSAKEYIEKFRIKTHSPETYLRNLSGGNQQKAAIAKCLDNSPEIFIFDEPTRGVDVGARREIYDFINALAREGMACMLISSDMDEVTGVCDRVIVMRGGSVAGCVTGEKVNDREIMYLATGVKQ